MRRAALLLVAAALTVAAGGRADWLVTRDGARIETRGAWEQRGAMVVFTLPNGTLSSLRLAEVDLDASEAATAEAERPPAAEPPPAEAPKEPVLVLTDRDVRRAPPPPPPGEEESEAAPGEKGEEAPTEPVRVVRWENVDRQLAGGVEIGGTLRNDGRAIVTDIKVRVTLVDDKGGRVGSQDAFLAADSLAPGDATTFRAIFPDALGFSGAPRFEVTSRAIVLREMASPATDDGSAGQGSG